MSREQPQFASARKGYNTAEVDEFIVRSNELIDELGAKMEGVQRDLADAYAEAVELREQLRTANEQLEKANQELDLTRGQEEALRMTLVAASRTKDEMLAAAQLEAENMVAEASAEAKALMTAAREEATQIEAHAQRTLAEIETKRMRAETDQHAHADAYAAQLAARHSEHLTAISQLETLYSTTAAQLETMIEDVYRGVSAGRSRLAGIDLEVPPVAPAAEAPAASPEHPATATPDGSEQQSALEKIAALTDPGIEAAPLPAGEQPPNAEPVAAASHELIASLPVEEPSPVDGVTPTPPAGDLQQMPSPAVTIEAPDAQPNDPEGDADVTTLDSVPAAADGPTVEPVVDSTATEAEPREPEPAADEEPDETAQSGEQTEEDEDPPDEMRRSFYDRRSGRLPRLGDDKQRDTASWMTSLREKS